MMTHSLMGTSI